MNMNNDQKNTYVKKQITAALLELLKEHKEFYTIIFQAGMMSIMLETILDTIQVTEEMSNLEAYMKSFWAYGIYGWLIEWINRGMPESGSDLLSLFKQTD